MTTLPKTITIDELTNALRHVDIHVGQDHMHTVDKASYPDALAHDLFRKVESLREPLYESGAVYADSYGTKWVYSGSSKRWYAFGSETMSAFDVPARPLTKLVPEFKFNIDWNAISFS
jgi:hypothetical protein